MGRGPLAGPVTAAAVVLPYRVPSSFAELLGDSKALSPAQRETAVRRIKDEAIAFALGWSSPEEIDRWNIHRATLRAMERAFRSLLEVMPSLESTSNDQIGEIVVDGRFVPELPDVYRTLCRAVPRADGAVSAVSAAAILAKVERDAFMVRCDAEYPGYGFAAHKGYPTRAHRRAVAAYGPTPLHRRSFRGVGGSEDATPG